MILCVFFSDQIIGSFSSVRVLSLRPEGYFYCETIYFSESFLLEFLARQQDIVSLACRDAP